MYPRCCRPVVWKRRNSSTGLPSATSWVHYTTSCNTPSSAPEDGRNNRPKHVELIGIINKPLLLHLVGCLYYLYQWCTVKQVRIINIYVSRPEKRSRWEETKIRVWWLNRPWIRVEWGINVRTVNCTWLYHRLSLIELIPRDTLINFNQRGLCRWRTQIGMAMAREWAQWRKRRRGRRRLMRCSPRLLSRRWRALCGCPSNKNRRRRLCQKHHFRDGEC